MAVPCLSVFITLGLSVLSTSATECFPFIMDGSCGDGWNGAMYRVRDVDADSLVQSGTLSYGTRGTDEICLDISGCYLLRVTSGSYPSEISWSFGTLTGGAPYGPAQIWMDENGALATGFLCPPHPRRRLHPSRPQHQP